MIQENTSDTSLKMGSSTAEFVRQLDPLAKKSRLRCFLNGSLAILALVEAFEAFGRCNYRWVLPIGQFSTNFQGRVLAFCAQKAALLVGCKFGLTVMKSRGLIVTARSYGAERPLFHSHARWFRKMVAHIPPESTMFESVYDGDGDEAGEQGYRLNRGTECILIEGPNDDIDPGIVPWEIFDCPLSPLGSLQGPNTRKRQIRRRPRVNKHGPSRRAPTGVDHANEELRGLVRRLEAQM